MTALEELDKLSKHDGTPGIMLFKASLYYAWPTIRAVIAAAEDHECAPGDLPDCPICIALAALKGEKE